MSIIDTVLAEVSPGWALSRARNRAAFEAVRAYEVSKPSRRNRNWERPASSQNAEAQSYGGLEAIRNSSRDLVRNDALAANIVRRLPAHIVGREVTVRPWARQFRDLSDVAKRRVQDAWWDFSEGCDPAHGLPLAGQMHLACRSAIEAGEVIVVANDEEDPRLPITLSLLEADHLDTAKTEEVPNGGAVIQGVQFDRRGRRVGYWLFDRHPGDVSLHHTLTSRFVPAGSVYHLFDVLRPGQARGISWLAPAALKIQDVKDLEAARLIKRKIEACFVAFVTGAPNTAYLTGSADTEDAPQGGTRKAERVAPGMFYYGGPGEDVKFGNPGHAEGIAEEMSVNYHIACAGVGIPYAMGTGDVSQASYSSQREDRLNFYVSLDHWQYHMMAPLYRWIWDKVHRAHERVTTNYPKGLRCTYAAPHRPWVDPTADGEQAERELRNGGMSWPQFVTSRGRDPEEVLAEIEEWKPRLDAVGVDFGGTAQAGQTEEASDGNRRPRSSDADES